MALPQARPPWLDTTMPRTPTATACGGAQGRTKNGWREKKVVMVCFHLHLFHLVHLFHLHLFHPKFVFFLFFIFTWTKKKHENEHHNTCLATARHSEDLWRCFSGTYQNLTMKASSLHLQIHFWKNKRVTLLPYSSSHQKRDIFQLKTNLKKTATMQSCPSRCLGSIFACSASSAL